MRSLHYILKANMAGETQKEQKQRSLESMGGEAEDQEELNQQKSIIPEHLQQTDDIANISQKSIQKILQNGKFKWVDQFKNTIDVQVIQTNFQSIKVVLHYGNFKLDLLVVYTEIDQLIFQKENSKRGSFGVVRFVKFQGRDYAVKGIKIQFNEDGICVEKAYKEYFLCFMAYVLGIGPKVYSLFGYDMLLTHSMAFFAMEECQSVKFSSLKSIENQLLKNLRIMHSINFVHLDIKPGNVAYSGLLQKHVFIDFGISKIIKQKPGEKTQIKFSGTLSYCSDEMKKCYYFSSAKFVDLYQNDLCCLKKTMEFYHQKLMILEEKQFFQQEEQDTFQIFGLIILVLRFKYFLQTQNIDQILLILQKGTKIKRVLYRIMSGSQIPKILSENQEIQGRLRRIKNQIFGQESQVDEIGNAMCEFFDEEKRAISAEKIIPISQIVQSKPELFDKYLIKTDLILKLFHFFQPFSKRNMIFQNKCELKKMIVKKIYEMKKANIKEPVFFSQKLRFTLIYFYQKLKPLKNYKIMLYLRLLFISNEEWNYVEKMQGQLIQTIDEPVLKMLRISEFILYRAAVFQGFQKDRNEKWTQIVSNISFPPKSLREQKIKSFLSLIMNKFQFFSCTYEQKMSTINQIRDISLMCISTQEKESIQNIKYIYVDLCRLHYSIFSQEQPKGLVLKIYSKFFLSVKVSLKNLEEKQQQKLFRSSRLQYLSQICSQTSQELLKTKIENHFQLLKKRNEFIGTFIEMMLNFRFLEKDQLYYIVNKIKQTMTDFENIFSIQSFSWLISINLCLQFIFKNQRTAEKDKKIGRPEKIFLIKVLKTIFEQFIKSQRIKKFIQESSQLQIHIMIIEVKFDFEQGKTADELQQKIQSIVELLNPLPHEHLTQIIYFITLFSYLHPYLYTAKDQYPKKILIHICQSYADQWHFYLFERARPILRDFVAIKNEEGKFNQNFKLILSFIEYFHDENQPLTTKANIQIFLQAVEVFHNTLNLQKLTEVYSWVQFNHRQLKCDLYAYFVCTIFLKIKYSLTEAQQLRQITRTTLSLKNMPVVCQIRIKPDIVRMYKHLVVFKSKRKAFICRRLELNNTMDENRIKTIVREMKNKVDKIPRKIIEAISQNLNFKLSRLQKI